MHDQRGRVLTRISASNLAPTPPSNQRGAARDARRTNPSLLGMALAGAFAIALGACNPTPSAPPAATPTVAPVSTPAATPTAAPASPTPVPVATSAPSAPTGAAACAPADLKAEHGIVEGAAGSRLTTVVLVAAITCSIDAFPALGLRDADGAILVGAASSGAGRIDLTAGDLYESNVRLANWCAPEPTFPLALEVVLGADELPVTGGSFPEDGGLPPCNGEGGPILEATGWVAAP